MDMNQARSRARQLLPGLSMAALLAVGIGGCGLGESAGGNVQDGEAPPDSNAVEVIMRDSLFEPEVIEVPAGTPVTVEIRNDGAENHNFTIQSLNTSTGPMEGGDVKTVTFTPEAGTTEFVCTWHEGMVGRIQAE
jgi:plastocyanin